MAQDIFLKLAGIADESQDSKHEDEIEVLSREWTIRQKSSMHSGSGGGAGKATVGDLCFDHRIDRASPNLLKYCLTGKHFDTATLVVRKAGGIYPERYPSNVDSIDIEIVGMAQGQGSDEKKVYESVTDAQNNSLRWLVRQLADTWNISLQEVFTHPTVSRKNLTEASTAKWH